MGRTSSLDRREGPLTILQLRGKGLSFTHVTTRHHPGPEETGAVRVGIL